MVDGGKSLNYVLDGFMNSQNSECARPNSWHFLSTRSGRIGNDDDFDSTIKREIASFAESAAARELK